MEQQQKFYPVGIQTFSEIIGKNYLYIDKTGYVYRMTHSASKYMFPSRCWPVRFIAISKVGRNCSKGLLSRNWRRNGCHIQFFTLI